MFECAQESRVSIRTEIGSPTGERERVRDKDSLLPPSVFLGCSRNARVRVHFRSASRSIDRYKWQPRGGVADNSRAKGVK